MTEPKPDSGQRPPSAATPFTLTRPARAIISTVVIVAIAAGVMLGFNALTSRFNQPSGQSAQSTYQGVMLGGVPAPDFTLKDLTGATVTLASLKGRPTILTFFDSVCPHTECSLMAQYLNITAQDMGADANKVNWVAVSVNPWDDTPKTAEAFLSGHQVKVHMTYLLGSQDQLQPLWDLLHIQSNLDCNNIAIHSTGVYLLDSQTHEQVFMDEGFDPSVLSKDVQRVLRDGANAFGGQQAVQTASAISITHTASALRVMLTAQPGQNGTYDYSVQAEDCAGKPVSDATVTMSLTMPSGAVSPINASLKSAQPVNLGAYSVNGLASKPGEWTRDRQRHAGRRLVAFRHHLRLHSDGLTRRSRQPFMRRLGRGQRPYSHWLQ